MESNALEKSINCRIASIFFASSPISRWIVRTVRLQSDFFESRSDFSKNFLDFELDTIEKQGIINLCRYNNECYAFVVLSDSEVTFLG